MALHMPHMPHMPLCVSAVSGCCCMSDPTPGRPSYQNQPGNRQRLVEPPRLHRRASHRACATSHSCFPHVASLRFVLVLRSDPIQANYYQSAAFGLALYATSSIFYRFTGSIFNPSVSLALTICGVVRPVRFFRKCAMSPPRAILDI